MRSSVLRSNASKAEKARTKAKAKAKAKARAKARAKAKAKARKVEETDAMLKNLAIPTQTWLFLS